MFRMLIMALAMSCATAAVAQKGKPIVAIYAMEDVAQTGQATTFSTMVETAIASTNKFRVIERQRLAKLANEQAGGKSGLLTTNAPGKVGGFEGADFLIYGTITSVSVVNKTSVGASLLSGMLNRSGTSTSCANAIATLGVDIKITDAQSGEIRYVTRISESQKSAASCGDTAQVDTASLLRSAAEKIATGLVTAIYPIQVAAVQADGSVVLNYGEGTLTPGSVFAVFSKGAEIRDPTSGEVISNDETKLGLVRVTEVTARISKATPVTPFGAAPPIGATVRAATTADLQTLNKSQKRK